VGTEKSYSKPIGKVDVTIRLFSKKVKTATVSSVVTEDVEKWIKARAKREGVSPSLWVSDILVYSMMTDAMTAGELSNIVHDMMRIRELAQGNQQFDLNPWHRYSVASEEYHVSRVRRGLWLYRRGNNVPDMLPVGLVTVLANTSDGHDFRSLYDPMSDAQTLKALQVLERSAEVKIEGDNVRVIQLADDEPEIIRKVESRS